MESAIAEIEDRVRGVWEGDSSEVGRSAAEDFAAREWCDLRDLDGAALGAQRGRDLVDRGVELDCADQREGGGGLEVAVDCGEEVRDVDGDVDEDVQCFDRRDGHGDQAAVGVMDEEVAS